MLSMQLTDLSATYHPTLLCVHGTLTLVKFDELYETICLLHGDLCKLAMFVKNAEDVARRNPFDVHVA